MNWDEYFGRMSKFISIKSSDPNTKVGAVIIGDSNEIRSCGYNGFPRGFTNTKDRWKRPTKYKFVCHAEANAITNAARANICTNGCRIYITHLPCSECAKLIIQSGIKTILVLEDSKILDKDKYSIDACKKMLKECSVELYFINKDGNRDRIL